MAKVKVMLSLESTTADYLKSEAERIGVPVSGFVSFLLDQYKRSNELPEVVKALNDILQSANIDQPLPEGFADKFGLPE